MIIAAAPAAFSYVRPDKTGRLGEIAAMTTHIAWTKLSESGEPSPGEGFRTVVRQAILDRLGRVHGYNLLFRRDADALEPEAREQAARNLIDNVMVFGFDQLTNGLSAFVPVTAEALDTRLVDVLPASMTVLHLHESAAPTAQLIASCKHLKSSGFRFALGSYCRPPEYAPLLELADYIKVDFLATDAADRAVLRRHAAQAAAALVAEKVETQEKYRAACNEGFGLFQGYYFCFPEMLKNHHVAANRISLIKILELLHREPMDLHEVAKWVKQDTSLTYRLLRLVNSPISAIRQEVVSIESALMVVGESMFRRMATLAIATELNADQPLEILRMGFIRGRFCEAAAEHYGLHANEQYLLGMLSMLPAMLCVPMDELTPGLPLRDEIRAALHGAANRERCLLRWLEFHERGDWTACDAVARINGLERGAMMQTYAEAVVWSEAAVHAVT
jgi:EAL and modified HD-GYP domain-containing signal transduction protein